MGLIMQRAVQRISTVLILVLAVSACTVRLAPEHEPAILQGLGSLSTATESFLASVPEGTKKADYAAKRQGQYAKLIGAARGLLVLVDARPEPKPAFLRWFGFSSADEIRADAGQENSLWDDVKSLDVPTDDQLNWYIDEIARMQSADAKSDLPAGAIKAFSKPIRRALKNAIVYEMALDR